MLFPANICPNVLENVKNVMASDYPDPIKVRALWGNMTAYQSIVLGHMVVSRIGNKVFAGPFRGMELIKDVMDGLFLPSLLGTYEWEMHDIIETAIAKPYKHILNIGCAYGYYSVGLALRMPNATIHAYDIDETARSKCKKMAEVNNVADRIIIGERFNGEDFERFADQDTLVFMDIEGGEKELLDPALYPALSKMDVIIELHDCIIGGLSKEIPARFAQTHDVKIMPNAPFAFPLDKIMGPGYEADHFDNLIATWEGRAGPTPFGYFTKK